MRLRFPSLPRPALDTLTWSLMHFAAAITVAYALARSWRAALSIGMIELQVQTAACMLHGRVWARADQGARPEAALGLQIAPHSQPFRHAPM